MENKYLEKIASAFSAKDTASFMGKPSLKKRILGGVAGAIGGGAITAATHKLTGTSNKSKD